MSEYMSSQPASQPLLELKDVWRSYDQGGSKLDVLTGASLTVLPGEMKALVGPSGSGSDFIECCWSSWQPNQVLYLLIRSTDGCDRENGRCCAGNISALFFSSIGCCPNFRRLKML